MLGLPISARYRFLLLVAPSGRESDRRDGRRTVRLTRVSDTSTRAPPCPQLYNAAIMRPRVQYAKTSDGVNIAYAVFGEGPAVVFASSTWGHLHPTPTQQGPTSRLTLIVDYLAASGRSVVLYDIRGAGFSDRDITNFSLEARGLDLEAVAESQARRHGLDLPELSLFHA
jgi:hypothetical protein